MRTHLLLMMGGSGTRLGGTRPKQYIEIDGIPIFAYILNKYCQMGDIDDVVIVSNSDWCDFVLKWVKQFGLYDKVMVVEGGNNRSQSVKNGLLAIKKDAEDEDIVLIHDATHPYVDEAGTKEIISILKEYEGATLGAYQYDTVYRINEENEIVKVLPRQQIVAGASPEAFKFKRIYDIYCKSSDEELSLMTSAGAIALCYGINMKVVPTNIINLKITYKNDLEAFKKMAGTYFFCDEKPVWKK